MVEVEVFSHKKLQRALTFTTAQVEEEDLTTDVELNTGLSLPVLEEVSDYAAKVSMIPLYYTSDYYYAA